MENKRLLNRLPGFPPARLRRQASRRCVRAGARPRPLTLQGSSSLTPERGVAGPLLGTTWTRKWPAKGRRKDASSRWRKSTDDVVSGGLRVAYTGAQAGSVAITPWPNSLSMPIWSTAGLLRCGARPRPWSAAPVRVATFRRRPTAASSPLLQSQSPIASRPPCAICGHEAAQGYLPPWAACCRCFAMSVGSLRTARYRAFSTLAARP